MTSRPAPAGGSTRGRPGAWERRPPWSGRSTAVVAACGIGAAGGLSGLLLWSGVASGVTTGVIATIFGLVVGAAAVAIGRATVRVLDDPLPLRRPAGAPWANAPHTQVGHLSGARLTAGSEVTSRARAAGRR